jgi:hypothetical protein
MTPAKVYNKHQRHPLKTGNSVGGGTASKNNMQTIDTSFNAQQDREFVGLANTDK